MMARATEGSRLRRLNQSVAYAQSPETFHRGFSSRNNLSYLVCAVVHNSALPPTRSLCSKSPAQNEQWCCSLGRRGVISRPAQTRGIPAIQRVANARASIPDEILMLRPGCVAPNAAVQTRMVSVAEIRLDRHKSTRPFKGIICDDISEFESHMPSHAVGLLQVRSPAIGTNVRSALGGDLPLK
jgi:hypothetical protein